ncbi:MAG: hypothetical protein M0P71_11035 [Melioribacteraceae bacterium]|nr:hypothetical protein [Melioribacteraceae bacterium]
MIILDLLNVLDDLREIALTALLPELTDVSRRVIFAKQLSWDGLKPYEDFVIMQNKIIKECVEIEMTPFGECVRNQEELKPLTRSTEIN